MKNELLGQADGAMRSGIARRSFQAGVLLVAREGQVVFFRPYGPARLDSVFDLASLTKPLATTTALMRLCAEGALAPNAPLADVLSGLRRSDLGALRLRHLLSHSSGLPAWRAYHESLRAGEPGRARQALWRSLARERLTARPGERSVYSDLGFMLLGRVIERVTGQRLDRVTRRLVIAPLGLTRTGFVAATDASESPRWASSACFVPTERLRGGRRLCGEVHDDNCRAVGGVCGHAGLFGSAYDVHLIAQDLVSAYRGRRSIFAPGVVRRFFDARPLERSSWALGWDTPRGNAAPACGRHFSEHSVGHLGFTGTSLWIDLDRDVWVVLLTNRVYYGREPNPMKRFRPRLHDAVMRGLDLAGRAR